MRRLLNKWLFPEACPLCGRLGKTGELDKQGCCNDCFSKYVYSKENAVIVLPDFVPEAATAVCASYYSREMKDAMHRFKFCGDTYMGKYFGRIIYSVLKDTGCIENTDIITSVPVSEERFRERGYNQSFLIAKELCRLSGIKYAELLCRNQQGTAQSRLLADQRRTAAENRFSIKEDCRVQEKAVLLIDDILTTGSTVNQCSRLIMQAGAAWVTAACVTGGRKDFS